MISLSLSVDLFTPMVHRSWWTPRELIKSEPVGNWDCGSRIGQSSNKLRVNCRMGTSKCVHQSLVNSSRSSRTEGVIHAVEQVQRFFSRAICRRAGIPYNNYHHRLSILGLNSLEYRRIFNDLCICYKIYYNMVDLAFDEFFATRNVSRYPIMSIKNNCQLKYTVKDAKQDQTQVW